MVGHLGEVDPLPQREFLLRLGGEDSSLPLESIDTVSGGTWLNAALERYPAVVLGSAAAARLGVGPSMQVLVGGVWCTVVGVLAPVPLARELDSAVLVGGDASASYLGFDGHPTTVYTRTDPAFVSDVQAVLGATANPSAPSEVRVSRPSDALAAAEATDDAGRRWCRCGPRWVVRSRRC